MLVVAAAIVVSVCRWRGTRGQRRLRTQRRQVIEQTQQRLRTASLTAADVSATVQDFLRARLDMPAGEVTPDEAAEHLIEVGYPIELALRCAEVLRECAARCFAPGQTPATAGDLAVVADGVLRDILAAQPRQAKAQAALVDELTRQRQPRHGLARCTL